MLNGLTRDLSEFCAIAIFPQHRPPNKNDPPENSGGSFRYNSSPRFDPRRPYNRLT
jgi:hypothetical protein